MFIVEVIPLQKGAHVRALSYFSSIKYPRGTILTIPLRNSEARGVVLDTKEVSTTKAALRAATFSLKKLPAQEHTQSVSHSFIKTAEVVSAYYACTLGGVLYAMLTPEVRNGEVPLPHTHHVTEKENPVPEVLQGAREERHLAYRSLVRETFAHSGSVHIVVPSSIEAETIVNSLASGIEDRVVLLSSTLSKKKVRESYQALEDYSKSKLIVTTTAYSVLERHDITTMIIEGAHSSNFTARTRPYIDFRLLIREYAHACGRRLIFSDLLPRSEEESLRRDGTYGTYGETPKRLALKGKLTTIDMKRAHNAVNVFNLFSDEVIKSIRKTRSKKGRAFLFAARRGLAPLVACIDCGYIFRSPHTGSPYSLIRIQKNGVEERWFVCGSSGARERAADTCPECSSWRLRERGIGIQSVYDELMKVLSGVPIILFDHTTANTFKKASFLADKFYSTKGAVMLGTQMALPYLTKPITMSTVVNMDALSATPTWRLQEENLSVLLSLREITEEHVYVQTRSEPDDLIGHAGRGSVELFYNEELELRKTFNYPPFATFIHLTWQGGRSGLKEIGSHIASLFSEYTHTLYSAPPSPRGEQIHYCLIRVASKDWPHAELSRKIQSLPPSVRVMINPDRIV